ncbi:MULTISPECIES: hypothetical protein [Brevibacillus]|uniref:hypothetical protein n=1 Tax=Brevibacillus TaxID=55080 RepID=UPI000D111A3C|nr:MULTISPECIES: hypothetical protein [Brevibacillus]PSJ68828.1 hypothetical protein C7J99_12630 [Brevibacillus brevis]RED29380.1 hypothetical protein DES34_106168 [Brevibacillus brevis]TQK62412.1 hypothetical protein FB479_105192 [Brevibacillus sp. AG162]VEF87981.1 Uncharacterised protein [Brevibacillus brevis]GEC92270.1 hypothetical protein BBR01nite_46010 [Brevibacillus brevis]
MKSEVINDLYYVGFEGEPEIIFMYEKSNEVQVLKLWNGYFELLLDCLVQQTSVQDGILHEYYVHEGWYEESPWEIKDVEKAVQLFKLFDVKKVTENESSNIIPVLPAITMDIISFLQQAIQSGNRVFIVYE